MALLAAAGVAVAGLIAAHIAGKEERRKNEEKLKEMEKEIREMEEKRKRDLEQEEGKRRWDLSEQLGRRKRDLKEQKERRKWDFEELEEKRRWDLEVQEEKRRRDLKEQEERRKRDLKEQKEQHKRDLEEQDERRKRDLEEQKRKQEEKSKWELEQEKRKHEMAMELLKKEVEGDVITMSDEDRRKAREKLGFTDKEKHIMFFGDVNAGKSTVINRVRGMNDNHQFAAKTGPFETTMERVIYKFANNVYIHDCPGNGTPDNPRLGYFLRNNGEAVDAHCLFGGSALTETGVKIAKQLTSMFDNRFPLVRSQCDKDLRDMKDAYGEITQEMKTEFREQAMNAYFDNLPEDVQGKVDFFLISGPELLKVVRGEEPGEFAMDEKEFWQYFQEMAKVDESKEK